MKLFISLLIVTACTSSCYHIYYSPNTANAPLLSEKGETRINALYATGGNSEFDGGELQFAHAVNKNVGIMVNGFVAGKSETVSDWNGGSQVEKGNGGYIELGGGFFKAMDLKKKWIGEIYAGTGFGSVKNDYGYGDHSKVGITKFFIQPSIGYKSSHFEFAVVPKISLVNWGIKENKITAQENESAKDEMKAIGDKSNFLAFEPAFLLRGGGKDFKIQLALSFSNYKSSSLYYADDLVEPLNASIGISINIKPAKK